MKVAGQVLFTGMLLVSAYSGRSWGVDCQFQRGYLGMEGVYSSTSDSLWQFDDTVFRSNIIANLYFSGVGRCVFSDTLSFKAQASGEYAARAYQPGALEDRRRQGVGILNEAVLSLAARDNLYLDIGKIRKTSGYLFSAAPLDLLRNISGHMRSVHVFGFGDRWRNFYDEGAYGISSSLYRTEGTYTFVAMPRLARNDRRQDAASEWDAILRTNSTDRYYTSYTTTGLKAFNPTFSLLAGKQKTLALGASGNLMDNLIFSVEGSLSQGQTWRHLDSNAARSIRQLAYVREPYKIRSNGVHGDIGVGLRYTNHAQTEYGVEYYGQSQGYSKSEWKENFDTIRFVNGGYRKKLPVIPPVVRRAYQQYSRMIAAETDNIGRGGNLLSKHYITLYTRTNKEQIGSIDWSVSGMSNLTDNSSVLNLHLSTPLKNNIEIYSGVAASFGHENSEFGTFGKKGNLYAGMRINW